MWSTPLIPSSSESLGSYKPSSPSQALQEGHVVKHRGQLCLCMCSHCNLEHPIPLSALVFFTWKGRITPSCTLHSDYGERILTLWVKNYIIKWLSHHCYFTSFSLIPSVVQCLLILCLQCLWLACRYFILICFHSPLLSHSPFFFMYLHYSLTICLLYLSFHLFDLLPWWVLLSIPEICPMSTSFQFKAISPQVDQRRILLLKDIGELSQHHDTELIWGIRKLTD